MEDKTAYFDELKDRIRSFSWISDQDLALIVSEFECRTIPKDSMLVQEGGRCDFLGFMPKGLVRIYTNTDTGDEFTNGFAKEGDFITEVISFYTQSLSLENIVTLEDTVLICTTYSKLQALFEHFPAFEKFGRIFYEAMLIQLKRRIIHRIHFDAQTRYLHLLETQSELLHRVPLKYLASYLSITDSTLSRIRRKIMAGAH